MLDKQIIRAAANALAFHSFKGHDFDDGMPVHSCRRSRKMARAFSGFKRASARADRRLSRAIERCAL